MLGKINVAYSIRLFPRSSLFFGVLAVCTSVRAGLGLGRPIDHLYASLAFDPTQPANQDRLTPHVWLTRTNSSGLFNAFSETFAGPQFSPADTEWAYGTADQYPSLIFANWLDWLNGQSPTNLVGKQVVAHLISLRIFMFRCK